MEHVNLRLKLFFRKLQDLLFFRKKCNTESHSSTCQGQCTRDCKSVSGSWAGGSYKLNYQCCRHDPGNPPTYETCSGSYNTYIGSFTHKPGSLGYQSYYTTPSMGQKFSTFTATTRWKPYPAQVQYNLDNSPWKTVSQDLKNSTATITVPITDGSHTLYFSESSSYITKFLWTLYVPVDNSPDTYTTSMQYDTYGNVPFPFPMSQFALLPPLPTPK